MGDGACYCGRSGTGFIAAFGSARSDRTGLQRELAERGLEVSYGAVWSFLAAEGLTLKKTLCAAEQERPDVTRKRARWRRYQRR